MNSKVLRIVLCALCAITLIAFLVAPCVSFLIASTNFFTLLFYGGGSVVYCIIGILGVLFLIAALVFSVVFKIGKNIPAALAMVGGYLIMAAASLSSMNGGVWAWGVYVSLFLGLCVFVVGLWLLFVGEPVAVPAQPAQPARPVPPAPPVTPAARVYIEGISGAYQGAKFDISDGNRIVFGRDASTCHVIFDQFETAVSRQHCTIAYIPATGMYAVRDMSKNGTYVNTMSNRLPANVETMQPRGTVILVGSSKNAFRLS